MAEKNEDKYRYPGVNYFTENEADIFCGRKEDTRKFLIKIMLNRTVVLHGDSGVGKSSLMQAGVIPEIKKLEKEDRFIPITIRFEGNKTGLKTEEIVSKRATDILVVELITEIEKYFPSIVKDIPYLSFQSDLWHWLKALEIQGHFLLLIFDQFEQLQSYSNDQIKKFKESLSEAFGTFIPQKIYEEIKRNSRTDLEGSSGDPKRSSEYSAKISLLEKPLRTKAIFVLREDKLGTMSLLADAFPDILKNDYLLKQLSVDNARKSILEPTELTNENGRFLSEFKYAPGAEDNLLRSLVDERTQLVDPLQIQIVCRDIERNVVLGQGKKIINQSDIPKLENAIDSFYWNSWKQQETFFSGDKWAFNERKNSINELLIVSGKRNLVHRDILVKTELDQEVIEGLVKEGLLREVPQDQNNLYYQLCHDRFIQPAIEDMLDFEAEQEKESLLLNQKLAEEKAEIEKKELEIKLNKEKAEAEERARSRAESEKIELENKHREEQRLAQLKAEFEKKELRNKQEIAEQQAKTYKMGLVALATLVVLGIAAVFIWRDYKARMEESGYLIAAKGIRRSNPTLSYEVAMDWANSHAESKEFSDFIKSYDKTKFSYLVGFVPSGRRSVYVQTDLTTKEILVANGDGANFWNRKGYIVRENLRGFGSILKRIFVGNEEAFLIEERDSIECRSITGKLLNQFLWEGGAITAVANSADGRYLLVESVLYDLQKNVEVGSLPNYSQRTKDEMAAVFLKDNRHVAVGYWSGDVLIYSVAITDDNLTPVKWFVPQYQNTVVTALAVGGNDEVIFAGDRSAEIKIWPIGKLADDITLDSVQNSAMYEPTRTLSGHTQNVNCIAVSPDGKYILSGSDDHQAILWDAHSGRRVSVLKGRDKNVTYVNFSSDGEEMITSTEDGRVQLWSFKEASYLFDNKAMVQFSPFDYFENGLKEYAVNRKYDTASVRDLFISTINYMATLPATNQYPEDLDYMNNLGQAIDSVKKYYLRLVSHEDYDSAITTTNKRLLSKSFTDFSFISAPELLLQTQNESIEEKYERFVKHHVEITGLLLQSDTVEIKTALIHLEDFLTISDYYQRDSIRDYTKSLYYLNLAINRILAPYAKKYPNDRKILEKEKGLYLDLWESYYYGNKMDSAMIMAQRIGLCRNSDGISNVCMIRTYLSMDQFEKAAALYKKNEYFKVVSGGKSSLKEYIQTGLTRMKERGISNGSIRRFEAFLSTRESPGLEKLRDFPANKL